MNTPTAVADNTGEIVFEVAWEVVNKVGGIYTVIKTKAPVTVARLGERYCCLGPYNEAAAQTEFEELEPESEEMRSTINAMRQNGCGVHYGRWLIEGYPKAVLFDVGQSWHNLFSWKKDLWDHSCISAPDDDDETNRTIIFGYLVAWFLGEFRQHRSGYIVAHFHEWLSGIGLVLCRVRRLAIATVFTTHATLLGRYLCAGAEDFYNRLSTFDVDREAGERGIYHRYCIERAATHCSHVFSTVSNITADEAKHLLKRKADVVVPNGLNMKKFSALHEFQNLHAQSKERIHAFVRGHFHGHYDFDLEKTLYFFLAGRYEFTNKGADIFIESLARLNHKMKEAGSDRTVVAFIVMPAKTNSFNVDSLQGQAVTKQLQAAVDRIKTTVAERLFESCARGVMPDPMTLLGEDDRVTLKRCMLALQTPRLPPIVTHNMVDPDKDQVLCALRRVGLLNQRSDRVKVVFHPEFINATSPLFSMDYQEFVRGCHLGVFPSYYEPWGYTSPECTILGIPSVTSNLSGFGSFIEDVVQEPSSYGLYIIDRRFISVDECINQLAERMFSFCGLTRRQRINLRNRTERLSQLMDWKHLSLMYNQARRMALERAYPDLLGETGTVKLKMPPAGSAPSSPLLKAVKLNPDDPALNMEEDAEDLS